MEYPRCACCVGPRACSCTAEIGQRRKTTVVIFQHVEKATRVGQTKQQVLVGKGLKTSCMKRFHTLCTHTGVTVVPAKFESAFFLRIPSKYAILRIMQIPLHCGDKFSFGVLFESWWFFFWNTVVPAWYKLVVFLSIIYVRKMPDLESAIFFAFWRCKRFSGFVRIMPSLKQGDSNCTHGPLYKCT